MTDEENIELSREDSAAPPTRVRWEVIVLGEGTDLAMLEKSFSDPSCCIAEVNGEYVISSDAWNEIAQTQTVQERANSVLSIVSGSAYLILGTDRRLTAGAVYEVLSDESRTTHILATAGTVEIRGFPATITSGGEVHHPADPVRHDVELASRDDHVALALRQWAKGPLDWDDLYRIYEIVQDDCGGTIQQEGWASRKLSDRFSQTATMHRHPIRNVQRHRNPMTEDEAHSFVKQLLTNWMEWKRTS